MDNEEEIYNFVEALENENNSSIIELTSSKIKNIKNDILQTLQIKSNKLKEMHKKLKEYRYCTDLKDLQEGFFYKEDSRIRIDYIHPSKITILLDEKKAMYLNHELEEVEYFNPKNTVGKIVFDIFNNSFLEGFQKAEFGDNFAIFYLDYKDEDYFYIIEIIFELNPLQIRMVKFDNQEERFSFGLKDHNFNNSFNKNFFSMANPLLRNTKEK